MKIVFLISLLFFSPFFASANIVINEVMYNLPKDSGADAGREWVEIHNNGTDNVDLSKWRFYEGGTNHRIKPFGENGSLVIPFGGYAVIADKPEKFLIDWPDFSGVLFDSSFSLKNSGEALVIKDGELKEVDGFVYDSGLGADGDGNSLQKVGNDWTAAPPTPGAVNFSTSSIIESKEISKEEPAVEGTKKKSVKQPLPDETVISVNIADQTIAQNNLIPENKLTETEPKIVAPELAVRELIPGKETKTEASAEMESADGSPNSPSSPIRREGEVAEKNITNPAPATEKAVSETRAVFNPEIAQTASVVSAISDTVRGANEWLTLVLLLGILAGIGSLFIRG